MKYVEKYESYIYIREAMLDNQLPPNAIGEQSFCLRAGSTVKYGGAKLELWSGEKPPWCLVIQESLYSNMTGFPNA